MDNITLGELTKNTRPICYGVLKPGIDDPDGIPLIRVTDISSNFFDDSNLYKITPEIDANFKRSKLNGGELLLSIQGTIGKVAICPDEYSGANISRTIALIDPDSRVLKNYLRFYFIYMDKYNKHYSTGSTRASLNIAYLRKLKIPLPSLEQQKQIANILDTADAYRQKTKAFIDKYDKLTQSLFLDMFGDPVTNPKHWKKVSTITYSDCIVPGRDKPKSFTGDIPWITTADLVHLGYTNLSRNKIGLSWDEIKEVRARIIPKNSVIMTCVGDLGVVSINTRDIVMNQQLHAFICHEELNEIFLMHNLSYQTPYMNKMASSTTVPYMNKTVANNTPTIVPPLELQNLFAQRVKVIEAQKALAQQELAKADELFNSLLQKAFKGNLV